MFCFFRMFCYNGCMGIISSLRGKTDRPLVMGILNATPDSFYPGSRTGSLEKAVEMALEMEHAGADIIDIGGESSRPGSEIISAEEEMSRLFPLLDEICRRVRIPVSLDTRKGSVAERALDAGVSIINDISALTYDLSIIEIVKKYKCDIILMHMENIPPGGDTVKEVVSYLGERIGVLQRLGIERDRITLDPGIGFGKDQDGNTALFGGIPDLKRLGCPVLMGYSRKSFIGRITGRDTGDRLAGTLACTAASCRLGADVLRVHDVKETLDVINVLKAIDLAHGR